MKDKAFSGFFVCFWGRFEYFFTVSEILGLVDKAGSPSGEGVFEGWIRLFPGCDQGFLCRCFFADRFF